MMNDEKLYDSWLFSQCVRIAHKLKLRSFHNNLLLNYWNFRPFSDSALQVIEVKVSDILYNAKFPFDLEGKNAVTGLGRGSWDRMIQDIGDKTLQLSISLRFRNGLSWNQTPQYRKSLVAIKRGEQFWNGCTSMSDLHMKCDAVDALYDDMKQNGYVASLTPTPNRQIRGINIPDLITVAMDRNGRIIRCEGGRHRLAIATVIGIEYIPVVLLIKHEDCQLSYSTLSVIHC